MRVYWCLIVACLWCVAAGPKVTVVRCPDGGVQPQAVVDSKGRVHLVYLKGADGESDVYYTRSEDGAKTWGAAIRVNSEAGAAIATGTVRGAHLVVGRGGEWVHVAWMGSAKARPRGPGDSTPMLYARMKAGGSSFEAQRNVISERPGLDGGGSVAADEKGNVYVVWHAPGGEVKGEAGRVVFVAASSDDGASFGAEREWMPEKTGVCGCCGMRAGVGSDGRLVALYRAANERSRDMYLIDGGRAELLAEWAVKTCPMSTASLARGREGLVAAWESGGQVWLKRLGPGEAVRPAGGSMGRKHPSVAVGADGRVLLAWAEGTGWKRGGSVGWQVFEGEGLKSIGGSGGSEKGLAVWSLPSAVAVTDGFVIVY